MSKDAPGPETEFRVVARAQNVVGEGALVTPTLSADLDRLFEAYRPRLHALCLRILKDEARAEDILQEALLVAYKKLPDYEGNARFGTWIYSITRNLCFNAVRKRSEQLSDDGIIEPASVEMDTLALLQREEREALIIQASRELSPLEQEAIYLRYVEGLPQQQITELLNLSGSGARGLLQRCRRRLRREVQARLTELGHGESFIRGD